MCRFLLIFDSLHSSLSVCTPLPPAYTYPSFKSSADTCVAFSSSTIPFHSSLSVCTPLPLAYTYPSFKSSANTCTPLPPAYTYPSFKSSADTCVAFSSSMIPFILLCRSVPPSPDLYIPIIQIISWYMCRFLLIYDSLHSSLSVSLQGI